jgi:hypothetical protein
MKLLTSAKKIREALVHTCPVRFACAYLGEGWRKYLSLPHLTEAIVSPTFGSNPNAIEALILALGIGKVHFLNELHAKIYIGDDWSIVGSCNLSDNGMADGHLLEAAVWLRTAESVKALHTLFGEYKKKAMRQYPNAASKREQLERLALQWRTAQWHGLVPNDQEVPKLADYKFRERIHVAWYQPCKVTYNVPNIQKVVPDLGSASPDDYFSEYFMFRNTDDIQVGDWILGWHSKDDGFPRKNGGVGWMQVHHVVVDGINDDSYPKLAGQAIHLRQAPHPFRLDAATKEAIRRTLSSGDYPEMISSDDEDWHLKPADRVTKNFLEQSAKVAASL